jgi:hypothetical protein
MQLRAEQIRAFSAATAHNFETRMVDHLRLFMPKRFADLGDEQGVRPFVRKSVSEAVAHGCRTERQTARYVQLAVALGIDFPRSQTYSWIPEILSEPGVTLDDKLQRIFERLVNR